MSLSQCLRKRGEIKDGPQKERNTKAGRNNNTNETDVDARTAAGAKLGRPHRGRPHVDLIVGLLCRHDPVTCPNHLAPQQARVTKMVQAAGVLQRRRKN
eukprot:9673123-Alexandrium_andersonii.AAC.1